MLLTIAGVVCSIASLVLLTGTAYRDAESFNRKIDAIIVPLEAKIFHLLGGHYGALFIKKIKLYIFWIVPLNIIMMVFLFILSPILLIVMFPMTFASFLFLLAIALHWARAGGSRAALVARLGILFGVIGILLSATPGLRAN